MNNHVLIEMASKKIDKEMPDMPEGAFYNLRKGIWEDEMQNPLVKDVAFRIKKTTKKADIETGEDQKGE